MTTEQPLPPLDENQIVAERRTKLKAIREKGVAFPFRPQELPGR